MDKKNLIVVGLGFVMAAWVLGTGQSATAEELIPPRAGSEEQHFIIRDDLDEKSARPAAYNLKRWVVEEDEDPVQRALDVYKTKAEPKYRKRVWLTDRSNGKKKLVVEYTARDQGNKILFSPDEDFLYYLGIGPAGGGMVYGVNLATDKTFIFSAADNFQTVNCPGQNGYVVIQSGKTRSVYQVYTGNGRRVKTLTNIGGPGELEKNLCR